MTSCTYFSTSCSWTNIITTDLVILVHDASWTASWTTTSHGNTVSSDVCESVILDFACRLEFVVSKSQGQATLDFTSDPQLTKNASWPRNQSFTMTWAPLTSYRRNFAIPSRPQIFQHHCSWSDSSWCRKHHIYPFREQEHHIYPSLILLLFMNIRDVCSWMWWFPNPRWSYPLCSRTKLCSNNDSVSRLLCLKPHRTASTVLVEKQ